eukprot:5381331-Pleurochrysis_carterae.AAC.1
MCGSATHGRPFAGRVGGVSHIVLRSAISLATSRISGAAPPRAISSAAAAATSNSSGSDRQSGSSIAAAPAAFAFTAASTADSPLGPLHVATVKGESGAK